jgi:hypothetical protein
LKLPIDTIDFDFEIMDGLPESAAAGPAAAGADADAVAAPVDGVYCRGLFLEGARWDSNSHELAESQPKVGAWRLLLFVYSQPSFMQLARLKTAHADICCNVLCCSWHGVCFEPLT